jgi:hypothetical protein
MTSFVAITFDLGAPQLVVGNFFCARASKNFCALCALSSEDGFEAEMLIIHQFAIAHPRTAHTCRRKLPKRCTLRMVDAGETGQSAISHDFRTVARQLSHGRRAVECTSHGPPSLALPPHYSDGLPRRSALYVDSCQKDMVLA